MLHVPGCPSSSLQTRALLPGLHGLLGKDPAAVQSQCPWPPGEDGLLDNESPAVGEVVSSLQHSGPAVMDAVSCRWRKSRNMGTTKAFPVVRTPQEVALLTHSAKTREGSSQVE